MLSKAAVGKRLGLG